MNVDPPASYGTAAGLPRLLPVSKDGSKLVFELAAILPLIIYLASGRLPYQVAGRTALAGFIGISILPPLRALENIADFLSESSDFLDQACSISELRRTVWDANWGSVFPCANGSASDILTKTAIRGITRTKIPDYNPSDLDGGPSEKLPTVVSIERARFKMNHRRPQTLYILDCSRNTGGYRSSSRLSSSDLPFSCEILLLLTLLGLSTLTAMFGLYGTAACIVIGLLFRISMCLNNESPGLTGCMLVAIHENASTWYLYQGSRDIIDTLLNKPMIQSLTSPFGAALPLFLRLLSACQIFTMAYVAAQKGWDGVGLLVVICAAMIFDRLCYSDNRLAHLWLRREGVDVRARCFEFGSRTAMIGAIQVLKKNDVVSWMDDILVPAERRDAWLARLKKSGSDEITGLEKQLSNNDKDWVELNTQQTLLAVKTIKDSEVPAKVED
ncbi:hypothetical protein ACMFMG_003648 [Clarireedia jacksonii]